MTAPALSKDIVGTQMEPFAFKIEGGKIRELCAAIGDQNPIFIDPAAAKAAGYKDTPAPLTFPTLFTMWGLGFENLFAGMAKLGINVGRLLHMKEEYEYHRVLYPGDSVSGRTEVTSVTMSKRGDIVGFRTIFADQDGKPAVTANMTIFIRPEEA